MTCYKPIEGYQNTNGQITSARGPMSTGRLITRPCRRCVGCRLAKSREWAVRCMHEDRYEFKHGSGVPGSFITLTYNRENLPWDGSISKSVHQKFIRALRDRLRPEGVSIRYYMCGEYGADEYEQYQKMDGSFGRVRIGPGRPHYHYLIFGYDFPDKYEWTTHRDHIYYRSPLLEEVWTNDQGESLGFSSVGRVTPETAAYTARYVLKKIGGELADDHYTRIVPGREEPVPIEPEFCLMSLKPGIGAKWFEKYGVSDIYDSGDFVVLNGKKYATPKYYDKLLEDLDERLLEETKSKRRIRAHGQQQDSTRERLDVRNELAELKSSKLKRGYEQD